MVQLGSPAIDFGQMIAELYTIYLYKNIPDALHMMNWFIKGYGQVSEDFSFRTAIQVGAHLVSVTSLMGWKGHCHIEAL